jgi:hypothetical protein
MNLKDQKIVFGEHQISFIQINHLLKETLILCLAIEMMLKEVQIL